MSIAKTIVVSKTTSNAEIHEFGGIIAEALSFPSPDEFNIAESEGVRNIRLAKVGDDMAGGLVIREMGQWFGGRRVSMVGVRAVAVRAEYRGQGVAKKLMREMITEMHARGIALSALYPATQPVYRRVGYEQAGVSIKYRSSVAGLSRAGDPSASVRRMETSDHSSLNSLYTERAKRTNGNLDRDEFIWGRVLKPRAGQAFGYVAVRDGHPEGYVVFTKITRPDSPFYDLHLTDFVANTSAAAKELLSLLGGHRSMSVNITYHSSPSDVIMLHCAEQSREAVERLDWMLRIVDVRHALESRGYATSLSAEIHLDVRDDIIDANNRRFLVRIEDGRAIVSDGGDGRIRTDIRGLAPMYSGLFSATEMSRSGLVEGDDESLRIASNVFAGPSPWMPDMF
jgi:predicted acetyltransferase